METSQFTALPPVPETVTVAGVSLDIVPLKLGELPAFARALEPLAAKLTPEPDWLRLLSEEGEALIRSLSIACRQPVAWIEGLALDEAIRLAEIVFAANADFFLASSCMSIYLGTATAARIPKMTKTAMISISVKPF